MKLVKVILLTVMLLICVTGNNKAGADKVKQSNNQNEFSSKITDVTVFKDGHALFLAQGAATPQDGWCHSYDVPASVLGALWGFAAQKDVKVDTVKSGFEQKQIQRPCLSFAEMIKANAGKQAAIIDKNKETHQGIIIGIPQYSSEQEKQEVINLPSRYDMWGRYIGGQQIRKTKPEQVKQSAPFVILESEEGVELIALEDIKGIRFKEKDSVMTLVEEQKKRITEAGVNAEELMENLETLITVPRRIEIPALSANEWENLINALEQINDVSADSKEFIRQIIKFGRREIARGKVLMALAELANKGVNVRFPPSQKKYLLFNQAFDATLRRGIAIGDTDLELIVDKINAQRQTANSGERKRARRGTYKAVSYTHLTLPTN